VDRHKYPYQPLHSGNALQVWAWSIVLGAMIGTVAYYVWRLP
jgi:hypothetical protein